MAKEKAGLLDKKIGEQIKFYRLIKSKKDRNWLGEKISKSYQQVQNYEDGKQRVAASCLYLIAKALKTPIEKFFPSKDD
jgi:transcriptional regulator with XRE-family HTH domain